MTIRELNKKNKEAWNNFVFNEPTGTFFHLAEWKDVLERAFDFKTFYFMKEDTKGVTGVLPLALVNRPIFGPALISIPLCVYGSGLGDCSALEEEAMKKAEKLGVEYLELRGKVHNNNTIETNNRFSTFKRILSNNHDENLKSIPRKQRAEVRKAISANLETSVNQDIDLFYKIYSTSVRNLGTPVFSKKYLKTLIDIFEESLNITTINHNKNALTSVLSFQYKDQIMPYYGGGLPAARNYSAYPYMYWKVMEHATDKGLNIFDFGRSMNNSGAYNFKKNFGFKPEALTYYYHLVKSKEVPDINPDTPRNKIITSIWKKTPLPITNIAGPILYPVIA